MKVYGEYFYGNKISEYGLENGYVDYSTLAKAFDAVLNNSIIEATSNIGYWEMISGFTNNSEEIEEIEDRIQELENELAKIQEYDDIQLIEDKEEELTQKIDILEDRKQDLENEEYNTGEIFQYYIVSNNGADILQEINEIVFYNEELDMYVWGVTHYGTAWSYVLTDIKCNTGEV